MEQAKTGAQSIFWSGNALTCLLSVLLLALLGGLWWLNPFCQVLVCNAAPLSHLSNAQKANIELAAQALDGFIIAPGQSFSFNCLVGQRTGSHGFYKSASYLGAETPSTFGGGICLVSSLLYRDAIELALFINERNPHTRTIESVPPGLDATVSSGVSDLRFTNNTGIPLQLSVRSDSDTLKVAIKGERDSQKQVPKYYLRRAVSTAGAGRLSVTVERQVGSSLALLSRDVYWLPTRPDRIVEMKR